MDDGPTPEEAFSAFDTTLPFHTNLVEADQRREERTPIEQFLYLGQPKTAAEFSAYVSSYDFGAQPPDYVILHQTASPCTMQTLCPQRAVHEPCSSQNPAPWLWDSDEHDLSEIEIMAKRRSQLERLRDVYCRHFDQQLQRWETCDRGPHLFIDDRWIWLFTPMRYPGMHAGPGNQYRDERGRLHASIGIQVIGYYEHQPWPAPVARLVGHAVAALKQRLDTFELRTVRGPGGVSSHRDWGRPQCPGAAISEAFYLDVLRAGWSRLHGAAADEVGAA
jgi:hypothetical protein